MYNSYIHSKRKEDMRKKINIGTQTCFCFYVQDEVISQKLQARNIQEKIKFYEGIKSILEDKKKKRKHILYGSKSNQRKNESWLLWEAGRSTTLYTHMPTFHGNTQSNGQFSSLGWL